MRSSGRLRIYRDRRQGLAQAHAIRGIRIGLLDFVDETHYDFNVVHREEWHGDQSTPLDSPVVRQLALQHFATFSLAPSQYWIQRLLPRRFEIEIPQIPLAAPRPQGNRPR